MDINVSDRIRKAAACCKKGFSCLQKGKGDFCAVEDCVNDSVLFVKSQYNASCPYQQSFGNEFICNCPVRKELYDKYRI